VDFDRIAGRVLENEDKKTSVWFQFSIIKGVASGQAGKTIRLGLTH